MEKPFSLFSPFEQAIDHFIYKPVTNWQHFFNPQFTFNYNPEDQDIEQHVLDRVGSYGSQLSTLIDMIALIRTRLLDESQLSDEQRRVVREFEKLDAKSKLAVADFRGKRKSNSAQTILDDIKDLQENDTAEFDNLKKALAELSENS